MSPQGNNREGLAADAIWSSTSLGVHAVMQAVVVIAMVRLGGIEDYGRYAYAAAVVGPVALIGGLKLRSVVASDAEGEVPHRDYRLAGWLAGSAAMVAVLALASIDVIARGAGMMMMIVMVVRGLDGVTEVEYGSLQREGRFRTNAQLVLLNASLTAVSVVMVLFLGCSLELALVASAGASTVTYLAAMWATRAQAGAGEVGQSAWKGRSPSVAWRLAPLGAANAIGTARQSIPRIVLEWSIGRESVGMFVATHSLLSILALPITAVGVAATPRLSRLHAGRATADFGKLLRQLVAFGGLVAVLVVLGAILAGQMVLDVVYSGSVRVPNGVIALMAGAIGIGFPFMFYGTAANAMRLFSVQLKVALFTIVIASLASLLLIPAYGMQGAAVALLLIAMADGLLYWRLVRSRVRGCILDRCGVGVNTEHYAERGHT